LARKLYKSFAGTWSERCRVSSCFLQSFSMFRIHVIGLPLPASWKVSPWLLWSIPTNSNFCSACERLLEPSSIARVCLLHHLLLYWLWLPRSWSSPHSRLLCHQCSDLYGLCCLFLIAWSSLHWLLIRLVLHTCSVGWFCLLCAWRLVISKQDQLVGSRGQ